MEDCEQSVMDVCKHIGIKLNPWNIVRAHRVGKRNQQGNRPRPIIAKFQFWKCKEEIRRNKSSLKGIGIGIKEDYSFQIREERKLLFEAADRERDFGKKAFVKFDRLYLPM